jgi:hypothetical protein
MGLLTGYACPCGNGGLSIWRLQPDELVGGYTESRLRKCGDCGRIFVYGNGTADRDFGKVVGRGRTFEQEQQQGLEHQA